MWSGFALVGLVLIHSLHSYELPRWGKDEEGPAGLALPVDVDAVVGLLLPHVLEGCVLAGGHADIPLAGRVLAFRDGNAPGRPIG